MNEKQYLITFIKEKLHGKIENLKEFNFIDLQKDYGATTAFDPDDTMIARCIYCLLWETKIPELSFENLGNGKKYRGDTLNTFNTLFGSDKISENGKSVFENCLEKFGFNKDEIFKEKILKFKKNYTRIGNFSILPCVPNYSLNYYRGDNRGWGDYYDRFLIELEKCFLSKPDRDKKAQKIIEKNEFFFGKFKNSDNKLLDFCKLFYLEDYIDNEHPKKLFGDNWIIQWRFKNPNNQDKRNYKEFAEKYIDTCCKIIEKRSERIITKLDKILSK